MPRLLKTVWKIGICITEKRNNINKKRDKIVLVIDFVFFNRKKNTALSFSAYFLACINNQYLHVDFLLITPLPGRNSPAPTKH